MSRPKIAQSDLSGNTVFIEAAVTAQVSHGLLVVLQALFSLPFAGEGRSGKDGGFWPCPLCLWPYSEVGYGAIASISMQEDRACGSIMEKGAFLTRSG